MGIFLQATRNIPDPSRYSWTETPMRELQDSYHSAGKGRRTGPYPIRAAVSRHSRAISPAGALVSVVWTAMCQTRTADNRQSPFRTTVIQDLIRQPQTSMTENKRIIRLSTAQLCVIRRVPSVLLMGQHACGHRSEHLLFPGD